MAEEESLDHALCQEMAKYVEELTTSGNQTLDEGIMKSLKRICRLSDGYVAQLHRLIMTQLEKEHAEIRLSAFQIANEIFIRSHHFRELVLSDFHTFLELTAEIDFDQPLPPPKQVARNLKRQTVAAVQKWFNEFGGAYKKLTLGYNFLKNFKKVEFDDASAQNVMERRVAEERERRRREFQAKKLEGLWKEMAENTLDIQACIIHMESGIDLILPNPDFEIDWETIYASASTVPSTSGTCAAHVKETTELAGTGHNSVENQTDILKTVPSDSEDDEEEFKSDSSDELNSDDDDVLSDVRYSTNTQEMQQDSSLGKRNKNTETDSPTKKAATDDLVIESGSTSESSKSPKIVKLKSNEESDPQGVFKLPGSRLKPSNGSDKKSKSIGLTESEIKSDVLSRGKKSTQSESGTTCTSDDSDYEDFEEVPDNASMISKTASQSTFIREHGFGTWRYNLSIDVAPEIIEDDNNTDIISNLLEAQRIIDTKYGPMVSRWLEIVTKFGGSHDQVSEILELRKKLTTMRDKYEFISKRIEFRPRKLDEPEESTSKTNRSMQAKTANQWQIQSNRSKVDLSSDPTTSDATLSVLKRKLHKETQSSASFVPQSGPSATMIDAKKEEMLKRAPKVQFDADLNFWGMSEKDIKPPSAMKFDSLHKFWSPSEHENEIVTPNVIEAITSRKIAYTGKYEPVKWACRAPMPNGKLCERRDRFKCPFHGKIVERDDKGIVVDHQPGTSSKTQTPAAGSSTGTSKDDEVPDWQDPELLREIEAAKGVDLGSSKGKGKGKGKRKKKEKYPGLTNLKQTQNTARNRLEKRVLSRRALKKVAADLDKIDDKKFKDKFCNQFNYHFSK